jgi:sterol desaturase/sphingolipid hydroxylase (fatty acid hydroxylase superfamily)
MPAVPLGKGIFAMSLYMSLFLRTMAEWFAFMFLVYFVMASAAYRILWVDRAEQLSHKRIQQKARRTPNPFSELSLSVQSLLLLAVMLGGVHVLTALGWAKFYDEIGTHGIGYFWLSMGVIAVVHDTYYYWAHRWMHSKLLFDRVHRVHHQFINPTPFASFAFHPLEGVIEIGILGALLLVMPVHPWAVAIYFTIHTALNVVSHLGFEFYPAWVSRWFITSTHHNLHHSRFTGHYMLYFNIWDRAMGTNHADYRALAQRLAMATPHPAPAVVDREKMGIPAGGA